VVIGDRNFWAGDYNDRIPGDGFSEAILKGSLTVYAGSVTDKKNLILNADTTYDDPNSFDTLGLIASDEVIVNGEATGGRQGVLHQRSSTGSVQQMAGAWAHAVRFDADH
jgi:hypothetical protein